MDIEKLRQDIIEYLETETMFNPSAIIEIVEVENMSYEQLLEKGKELGVI